MAGIEWLYTQFVVVFFTLAVLSFVYKNNPFFKFAEHTFVGYAVGYAAYMGLTNINDFALKPLGTGKYEYLIALIFGLLLFAQFYRKTSWYSRWPTAFLIGATFGMQMRATIQSDIINQITGTIAQPIVGASSLTAASSVIFIALTACAVMYFFFTSIRGYEKKAPMNWILYIGKIGLMGAIGASFGYGVLGMSTLIISRIDAIITALRALFI